MDDQAYCEMFYAAHYLPVAVYAGGSFLCSAGFYADGDPYPFVLPKLMELGSPAVYVSSDTGYYGYVQCKDGVHSLVLGPAYSTPVTDEFIRSYMSKNAIPPTRYGEIASFLGCISQYTYNQFLNLLLYLHFTLTGEKLELERAFSLTNTEYQAVKNLFIGLITIIGKFAAIPGGMDIEETYHLIDTYIQECEKLQTEEAVKNLQYNMTIDFARRVAQQKLPDGISKEVFSCMQFIATHINEPICATDVVSFSGKSRAYLFKKFRNELGMSIGAYMMDCRLRRAKSLLKHTDKSLGEISSFLCFFSQSHFQNAFKKHFHMTPFAYRKKYDIT